MTCNGLAGAGQGGVEIAPPDDNKYFKLDHAEIVTVNTDVETLLLDLEVLIGFTEVTLGLSCTEVLWGQSSNCEVSEDFCQGPMKLQLHEILENNSSTTHAGK